MANGENFNDTIANGVLGAVNILTEKALSDLKFDKTYSPCTIIERSSEDKNIYTCEYENARFEAYSDQSFFAGELVQVLVPQNNWDNQKRILSRVMTGNSAAYDFKYPFDDFVVVGALEVEDLYSMLAGCAPIFLSDLENLTGEVGDFLRKYYRYEQNLAEGKTFVWGTTPYDIDAEIERVRDERIVTMQNNFKTFTMFPNPSRTNRHVSLNLLRSAITAQGTNTFFSLVDLEEIIETVKTSIEENENYSELEKAELIDLLAIDKKSLTDFYQDQRRRWQQGNNSPVPDQYVQNVITRVLNVYPSLGLTAEIDPISNKILNIENIELAFEGLFPEGSTLPNSYYTARSAIQTYKIEAAEYNKYYYIQNNELKYMVNQPQQVRELEELLANLKTQWLAISSTVFQWSNLSRDEDYETFMSTHAIEPYQQYITAWVTDQAAQFKGRAFEEIYNLYRITPICGGPDTSYGFWANRRFENKLTGKHTEIYTRLCSFVPAHNMATVEGFTKAGLQLDITSLLSNYKIIKGEYGVKILVEGTKKTASGDIVDTHSDESAIVFDDEFLSRDFYGNVYAYTVPYSQQKLLNIEDYTSISRITLYVWQTLNQYDVNGNIASYGWECADNTPVPYKYKKFSTSDEALAIVSTLDADEVNEDLEYELPQNLFIAKPYLGLGFAVQELARGKLILYTEDSLEYNADSVDLPDEQETRTLKAIWVKATNGDNIEIYPSWERDPDTGEIIELQDYERQLFYTRDDIKILDQLIEYYQTLYEGHPFDSTRAQKQQDIIDMITKWIGYEKAALLQARSDLRRQYNETGADIDRIPLEIAKLNELLTSLDNELSVINSIADLSLLTNQGLYTQRDVDLMREKIYYVMGTLMNADPNGQLTQAKLNYIEKTAIPAFYEAYPELTPDTYSFSNFLTTLGTLRNPQFTVANYNNLPANAKPIVQELVWYYYVLYARQQELQTASAEWTDLEHTGTLLLEEAQQNDLTKKLNNDEVETILTNWLDHITITNNGIVYDEEG